MWTLYHLYLSRQGDWSSYLSARGLEGDSRLDTSYAWSRTEIIADTMLMLDSRPRDDADGGEDDRGERRDRDLLDHALGAARCPPRRCHRVARGGFFVRRADAVG